MTKPDWLKEVEEIIPELQEVVDRCRPEFRATCFELLLEHLLMEELEEILVTGLEETDMQKIVLAKSTAFESFLNDNGLSRNEVEKLVDLGTGEVFIRAMGTNKKAEVQRRLAALVGAFHYAKDGNPTFPQDELVKQCENLEIYDSKNFAANMTNSRFNGSVIFSKDEDNWKFTPAGMMYLVEILKMFTGLMKK